MTHGSLFSGIGGFDLASEWMGWTNVFHCEWMEFPRKVLDYYWPNAESHIDITKTDFKKYENKIDVLTGGFPCQPFSLAGKRKGTNDERYLWHEMLRAIQDIKPKYVIAENVFGITNIDGGMVFEQVCLDLENEGYEVQPFIIPACAKNAPHRRDRVWFVAYAINGGYRNNTEQNTKEDRLSKEYRKELCSGMSNRTITWNATNADSSNNETQSQKGILGQTNKRRQTRRFINGDTRTQWNEFPTQSPVCGGDDGLPTELDGITFSKWRAESIKGYGNAIVPQVAYEIFKTL
jgi:DNA (cytosine-5)-methyltransferase 1